MSLNLWLSAVALSTARPFDGFSTRNLMFLRNIQIVFFTKAKDVVSRIVLCGYYTLCQAHFPFIRKCFHPTFDFLHFAFLRLMRFMAKFERMSE